MGEMWLTLKCDNCSSESVKELNACDSQYGLVVTSDAQKIENIRACRTLCEQCGCMQIHYFPPDRLKDFFRSHYNVSDEVQDNLIVVDGNIMGKRARVINSLFSLLENRLTVSGNFLEIACGLGSLSILFKNTYPQWNCFGIDPSPQIPKGNNAKKGGVNFIQDFFDLRHFQGMVFDLIVAHGFLNRSPVLPELLKIRKLSTPGTLLSLELLLLEHSVFAPYIWDHSFMYPKEAFVFYLAQAGFMPLKVTDCISSVHYLCECQSESKSQEILRVGSELVEKTQKVFYHHINWWKMVCHHYEEIIRKKSNSNYALFGAGLFNAVLLSLVPPSASFSFVIDEVKGGSNFFGLPVIGLEKAAGIKDCQVLICTRPSYVRHIEDKLRKNGINFRVLNPEE